MKTAHCNMFMICIQVDKHCASNKLNGVHVARVLSIDKIELNVPHHAQCANKQQHSQRGFAMKNHNDVVMEHAVYNNHFEKLGTSQLFISILAIRRIC